MIPRLMILLFLGSWRSTLIIATSIPLAVLGSICALSFMGETLNIMTLGGLALAAGRCYQPQPLQTPDSR
jgi:multidrug efflux pump subunit AcrB